MSALGEVVHSTVTVKNKHGGLVPKIWKLRHATEQADLIASC